MNTRDFKKLMAAHRIKGAGIVEALRLHLVEGLNANEAATQAGIDRAMITRYNARLARPLCPHCGRPMKQ